MCDFAIHKKIYMPKICAKAEICTKIKKERKSAPAPVDYLIF